MSFIKTSESHKLTDVWIDLPISRRPLGESGGQLECLNAKIRGDSTPCIYIYMGVALKTLWIVPRWSGRLEQGGYVKGHDPEVSKAQIEDHVFMIWHHMSTWVCGLTRGHMERRRDLFQLEPAIVFTLRIQLDCKHSWYRWHEFQS